MSPAKMCRHLNFKYGFATFLVLVPLFKLSIQKYVIDNSENFYFASKSSTPENCYPEGTNGATQFLIGYGSLMQNASKSGSYPDTGESVPIRVSGYTRSWTCRGTSVGRSTTYLGVDAEEGGSFNGVYFQAPSLEAIKAYDTREQFYCRVLVPLDKIKLAISEAMSLPEGEYWLYVTRPEDREQPTEEYPMVESYVDTFLSGCIELEEKWNVTDFGKECVTSTKFWDSPWKNDRIYPRRPFFYFRMAGKVDRLLHDTIPEIFKKIQIEG